MKNKRIKDASKDEIDDFEAVTTPLIKFIRENWDADVKPKGYDAYKEDYEEFDDSGKMVPEFDGLLDTSACCPPFPGRMSMPSVAYNDTQQGYDPLETMVGSLVAYGMAIGEQRAKLDRSNNYLIKSIHYMLERMRRPEGLSIEVQKAESESIGGLIEMEYPHLFEEK